MAATKAVSKTDHNTKKNLVPWWNHECNESIKLYKRCLNKFKKSKSSLNHIQLKKSGLTPDMRYITKKSKTEAWQKYTSSINTSINTKTLSMEVWNKIKAIYYHRLPSVLQHNNTSLSTPSDITKPSRKCSKKIAATQITIQNLPPSKTFLKCILQTNQS